MAMHIDKNEGHYFQYIATASNVPSLSVDVGEIRYWVQKGPANEGGLLLVRNKSAIGGQRVFLPALDHEGVLTLFIQGKESDSEYEFRRGGVGISDVAKKELAGLPTGLVEKVFGKFEHRSDSTYD